MLVMGQFLEGKSRKHPPQHFPTASLCIKSTTLRSSWRKRTCRRKHGGAQKMGKEMEAANLSDTTAVMVMVKTKVFCGDAFFKNNSRAITSKNLHPIPFETCLFFVQCHNLSCVLLSLRLSKWELQTIAQSVESFLEPPKVRAFFFEDFMYIHHFEYLYVIVQCISKNYILNIIKQQVNKVHYFAHPSDGFQAQPFQEIICLPVHPSFALNLNNNNNNNNNNSSSNNNNNNNNHNHQWFPLLVENLKNKLKKKNPVPRLPAAHWPMEQQPAWDQRGYVTVTVAGRVLIKMSLLSLMF